MVYLNKATLIGTVASKPVMKDFNNTKYATFTLLSKDIWRDANGEHKEVSEWTKINVWGKLAETVEAEVAEGHTVLIEGRIKTNKYIDKDGTEKSHTVVVVKPYSGGIVSVISGATARVEQNSALIDDAIPF